MVPPVATDVQGTMDTQIATFSDRLSVNGVAARRSKAQKISGGIAAHASSDMFKSPVKFLLILTKYCKNLTEIGLWQAESQKMGPYVRIKPPVRRNIVGAKKMTDRLNEESSSRKVRSCLFANKRSMS